MWLFADCWVALPSYQIPTTMSDSKSLNTSLWEVMISYKNESVFIWGFSNLPLQIIFDAWWASINVGLNSSIAGNNSRPAPVWQFCLHGGIEDSGSPGIICSVWHQVLCYPSEHVTSSMGKHLVATAHITKLNKQILSEVTALTSSKVNETALVILRRQGSRWITIIISQRKFILDI